MSSKALSARLAALAEAATLCEGRVDPEVLGKAKAIVERAGKRMELSGDYTIVALAGATGSGKSTLFNALTGTQLAATGVRRPTTSTAMAAGWGAELPHALLDWLDVPRRHLIASDSPKFRDLVLIDLPDHDSTEDKHRIIVDRFVPLVDMLIWVVDPQKYADAALHDSYLRPLAAYSRNMVIVLNQTDRLWGDELDHCLADLRRLLDAEGLAASPIVPLSAMQGTGVQALKDLLAKAVADKTSATRRLSTDLDVATTSLSKELGNLTQTPRVSAADRSALVAAMADVSGLEIVVDSAARSWKRRGTLATGWPFVSWVRALRPDPLRRLRLGRKGDDSTLAEIPRTSIPKATPVQLASVDTALRQVVNATASTLPRGWADAVKSAARGNQALLADKFDMSIATAEIDDDRPRVWWVLVTIVQWLLMIAVVAGVLWWFANPVLVLLGLPMLPSVTWRGLPAQWVLVVGGIAGGVLLGLLSSVFVNIGSRMRARKVRRVLTQRLDKVTQREILGNVDMELQRYAQAVEAISQAT